MVVLDATIVNVALPAIQKALGFSGDSQLQWVVTAYALVFGGFLLLGGRLADLFGRRRLFLIGIVVFAVASLLGGFSQNPTQLIIFRSLQGLGGALLSPAALSLVLTIFAEGPARNRALGVWSMVAAGGGAVGLLLGGILTQYIDWRWVFFINLPIAAAVMVFGMRYVPKSLPAGKQHLDVAGALTITASLMTMVYALARVPENGWGSVSTITTLALSALLMVAFVINESLVRQPLIKLGIFARRNVTGGSLIQLFMPAAIFGFFFYLSIYLQQVLGYSPTRTGLADLPFTLMIIIVASVLSKRIAKLNLKAILVVAPLIVAAGLLYFARIPIHASYLVDILPGIVLIAGGMAAVFVTATTATTSGISHEESGLVSGLLNTGQQVGGAIGLAILSVISATTTKADMAAAQGNPAALTGALVHGFQQGFAAAAVFAVAASLVALFVFKVHKHEPGDTPDTETEAESFAAVPGA
jgi:EmrB/QacA subfamily drug resistance transporter